MCTGDPTRLPYLYISRLLPKMAPARPRIDGASLIDPALHNPALVEMLQTELSRSLVRKCHLKFFLNIGTIATHNLFFSLLLCYCVEYVVDRVVDVVDYALGRPSTSTRGRPVCRSPSAHAEFSSFAGTVLERAGVQLPVILGTLVYLDRAKPHLQLSLEEWACERVFLGALICANKVCVCALPSVYLCTPCTNPELVLIILFSPSFFTSVFNCEPCGERYSISTTRR